MCIRDRGKVGAISNVSATNAYSTFASNVNVNYYDITGSNNSSTQGYGGSTLGNPSTKWEATEAANLGLDLTLKNGKWDFVVDVYRNCLLYTSDAADERSSVDLGGRRI